MADVRNVEGHGGEDRKTAHRVGAFETLTMTSSRNLKVIRDGEVAEKRTYDDPPQEPAPTAAPTHTISGTSRAEPTMAKRFSVDCPIRVLAARRDHPAN